MTNQEWLNTLHGVTPILIHNCCCAAMKCNGKGCKACIEEWLKSEHGQNFMYDIAEEQDEWRV